MIIKAKNLYYRMKLSSDIVSKVTMNVITEIMGHTKKKWSIVCLLIVENIDKTNADYTKWAYYQYWKQLGL